VSEIDKYDLLEFFGLDSGPIAGLDIGASSVKVLQLGSSGGRIKVEHFAVESLEPGVVQEKNIVDKDRVVAAIRTAVKKSGITTKNVCVSIANSMAVTKVIKMAAGFSDKEIGNEIELEASKYIPYPLSEINLDYAVMGPTENVEGMVNVLLAFSKSDNVNNIAALAIDANLNPVIVDIDAYAIAAAFELVAKKLPAQGKNKIIAIFDIGSSLTTLNIIDRGNVVYMREQAFGSQHLVDEIQNIYGLTYEEAILGMRYESLPKDFYPEVLEPFKQNIAQQINRFCQFFFSAGDYSGIDYIFITGGCSSIFGLDKVVQDKLAIKTFVANPFDDMVLAPYINKDDFNFMTLRMMKCCGLALRNISDRKL
jgi:type IV pilus assembly protein PilM